MIAYPFCPKSTSKLIPGQFWPIKLTNSRYAAGRVLQLRPSAEAHDRRMFLAGLMDWCSESEPTSQSLEKAKLLDFGVAHTRMFSFNGFQVTGYRALEDDGLKIPLALDQAPHWNAKVIRGFEILRPSTPDQYSLPRLSTWGMAVIVLLAERYFVAQSTH
jgi:hypothetical protein